MPPKAKAKAKAIAKTQDEETITPVPPIKTVRSALEDIHESMNKLLELMPFQKEILEKLHKETKESLPNLLFYGPRGFPLEYMAYSVLAKSFEHKPFSKRIHLWNGKLTYYECDDFFEIQFGNPNMPKHYDDLCEFMKHVISTKCIYDTKHVFILRDIDIVARSKYHYALRVLLERFSNNVLFIATTHHVAHIESPLQSRFMMMRVPLPSPETTSKLMDYMNQSELPPRTLHQKPEPSRDFLVSLISLINNNNNNQLDTDISFSLPYQSQLQVFLDKTQSLENIRHLAYKTFQQGFSFVQFSFALLQHIKPAKYKPLYLSTICKLDRLLKQAGKGREPIYFERALFLACYPLHIRVE